MLDSDSLRRTALLLVLIGLLWNVVEGGVALWAGARSGSVAILAFGLDSIIELSRRRCTHVALEGRKEASGTPKSAED